VTDLYVSTPHDGENVVFGVPSSLYVRIYVYMCMCIHEGICASLGRTDLDEFYPYLVLKEFISPRLMPAKSYILASK
jgi:hypothetical protein